MFVVVVGSGGAGAYLSSKLTSEGHKVTVIDINSDALEDLTKKVPSVLTVVGDGSRLETMRKARIEKADVLAVLTGTDEKNLSIAMLAKNEFRVPRIVARVNDPKHEWLFDKQSGVDYAFNQDVLLVDAIMQAVRSS
jgi:trk system potassium uptake protein TrkA